MRTAVVLKGYPRLSETFIAQEIMELERRGLTIEIFSLRHPTEKLKHPIHSNISASVNYLPEYLYKEIVRVWRSWSHVRKWPNYARVYQIWLRDLKRDFTVSRVRRFGQSLVLAFELPKDVEHVYTHFLHTPASVTRYAALLRNISWSCSAHAVDIWTTPRWEIQEKLKDCDWLVTCTRVNQRYLRGMTDDPEKIHLVYHGFDFNKFGYYVKKNKTGPSIRLLSVGRIVEKKGYDDLLAALALIPDNLNWTLDHIGGGVGLKRLKFIARFKGIADRITWHGPCAHDEVLREYRRADIFVLASKIARNGDRDGLPNVLIEAQSQGIACISTRLSGIPECLEDEVTGLLAEPGDIQGLSDRITRLIKSDEERLSIGNAGQAAVRAKFNFFNCIEPLEKLLVTSEENKIDRVA